MGTDVKQFIRHYFQVVWNEGRVDRIDEFVDPGFTEHSSTFPFAVRGVEGLHRVILFFRTAFPDLVWTIEDIVAEGEKVVLRFAVHGTHRGSVLGYPGTGRRAFVTGMVIFHLDGGRLAEAWTQWDTLGLLQQLGVTEPAEVQTSELQR